MAGNPIPSGQSLPTGPRCDDIGAEIGGGGAFCNMFMPLQNMLTCINGNKDKDKFILRFTADQEGSLIEEGSTLTGMVEVARLGAEGDKYDISSSSETSLPPSQPSATNNVDNNSNKKTTFHPQQVQLVLEGTEHCLVYTGSDDGGQYIQGKRLFFRHVFDLSSSMAPSSSSCIGAEEADDNNELQKHPLSSSLRYSISIPKGIPNSMPRWKYRGDGTSHCSVSYEICALTTLMLSTETGQDNKDEKGKESQQKQLKKLQSISIPLSIRKLPVKCPSNLSLIVGKPITLPMIAFCGLYTYGYRDTYNYRPSLLPKEEEEKTSSSTMISTMNLHPGQPLQISIIQDEDIPSSTATATTTTKSKMSWRSNVVKTICKITQRIKWSATSKHQLSFAETPFRFNTWERTLRNVDYGTITVPTISSNKWLRMTYMTGKTINVFHEMVIYSYDKDSNILGTSPPITILLSTGYTE